MTMRFISLSRLVVRLINRQRCQLGLRTVSACALATLLAGHSHAQLLEGWQGPGAGGAVGTAAVGQTDVPGGYAVADGYPVTDPSAGVYVGPGGATTPSAVPSVMAPGPQTRLVNQPFPNGPFLQNQPLYQDSGMPLSNPCDTGCDIRYYASAEALYFRREHDERFTLSQSTRLEPFDYEWGGRVTVGRLLDCVNGYEFSYAGPFEWERERIITGTNLQSKLSAVDLPASVISTFDDATFHSMRYQARLNSFEANRRWWAWDIFSTLIGIRVVDYRENFGFASTNPITGNGLYLDEVRNFMVGPQVGGEFMKPLGLRTLVGVKGKGAVFANFDRNQLLLQNAGTTIIDAVDNDIDVAGLIEFGANVKYSITPSIRVMAGYDVWYLPGVATIPGQNLRFITPNTGAKVGADDELLIHGASFGAQVLF